MARGLTSFHVPTSSLPPQVCPDADFSHELGGGRIDRETWRKGNASASSSAHIMNATSATYSSANTPLEDLVPSDDEDIVTLRLSERFKSMNISHGQARFFGKSSGVMLIQKAIDLKKEVTGSEGLPLPVRLFRPVDDECYPVRSHDPDHHAYILIPVSSGNAQPETFKSPSTRSRTRNWAWRWWTCTLFT